MSKKAVKENPKHEHKKGARAEIPFKKFNSSEMAEFNKRRAAGEDEATIATDILRRKRG